MNFEKGSKWRVVKEGASLSGMRHSGGSSFTGWTEPLQVGVVLTCEGTQRGFGDGPMEVVVWRSPTGNQGVNAEFSPGCWGSPNGDYLEPFTESTPRLCWDHRVMAGGRQYRMVSGDKCDHGPHDDRPVTLDDWEA